MKRFRERKRALTGLVGVVVTLALIAAALQFNNLPFIHSNANYGANFANAGGLATGDIVTIDGVKVGTITGMALDGDKVLVSFEVSSGIHLGSTTSAAAKVLALFFPADAIVPGIHPSASVAPTARIDPTTQVGPGCVIGAGVKIGAGSACASARPCGKEMPQMLPCA